MEDYDVILKKLSLSKFRSSFHLRKYMLDYINEKGMDTVKIHAYDFINKRLRPSIILNDGKQTPMKGHPVFIAQHACGCTAKAVAHTSIRLGKRESDLNEIV